MEESTTTDRRAALNVEDGDSQDAEARQRRKKQEWTEQRRKRQVKLGLLVLLIFGGALGIIFAIVMFSSGGGGDKCPHDVEKAAGKLAFPESTFPQGDVLDFANDGKDKHGKAFCLNKLEGTYRLNSNGPESMSESMSGNYAYDLHSGRLWATPKDGEMEFVGAFHFAPPSFPSDFAPQYLNMRDDNQHTEKNAFTLVEGEVIEEVERQAKRENHKEDVYFVLPSQLNGAEYSDVNSVPAKINEYKFDHTGGPRGQLSVHPAVGQFVLDNAAREAVPRGISSMPELPLVGETAANFKIHNGYLRMPTEAPLDTKFQALINTLRLTRPLMMSHVPACGLAPNKQALGAGCAGGRVGLVYASAVPVQAYENWVPLEDTETQKFHRDVAFVVLVQQYLSAMAKIAQLHPADNVPAKVYLMPVGGGVFNNPLESIAKAMAIAYELLGPELQAALDVHVLLWRGNDERASELPGYESFFAKCSKLNKLIIRPVDGSPEHQDYTYASPSSVETSGSPRPLRNLEPA